ncbi:MAG: flippase-like domain-containing protein [Solobacterium sp.]|nr:flippase-like domain-containing protein [Solobacterium sp.]
MSEQKHSLRQYLINLCIILVLSGIVVWIVFKNHAIAIIPILKNANPLYMILIVGMMILIRIIIGYNLMRLARMNHPNYRLSQGIINSFVGGFFNMITPSESGGQFVQAYLFKKQGIPLASGASILWSDFMTYQITMVSMVLLLIFLRFGMFYQNYSQYFIFVIFGFIVNAMVILGLWALVRFPKFYHWLTTKGVGLGAKLKLIRNPEETRKNLEKQVDTFAKEANNLRKHPTLIMMLLFTNGVRLLLYYSIPFFCAKALHIPVTSKQLLDIIALTSFVTVINAFLPMPGSSGGTEATFVLMFSTIFSAPQASSIMIVWRFLTYYIMLIISGLVSLYAKLQKEEVVEIR